MKTCNLIISAGFIAGVPHRNPDLSVVSVGDRLNLVLEPENPYDPAAIKLVHQPSGQFLGYVPREQCVSIHRALACELLPSSVVDVVQPHVKWKELGYQVTVTFDLASPIAKHPIFEGCFGPDPRDPNF